MARFKNIPVNSHEGRITYGSGIVDEIVFLAINEIPNVSLYTKSKQSKAVRVVFANDGVHVDVQVKTHYAELISEVAFKIQESIRHNVEVMTEYRIANVNVSINGVILEDAVAAPQTEENVEATKEGKDEK